MYANPIHPGHIECLERARALGDYLAVIVNNDVQQEMKIGSVYQSEEFRATVVAAIKPVDEVFLSVDKDGSVCESLSALSKRLRKHRKGVKLIFAKGGDRNVTNIPETEICKELDIEIVDGLGDKTHNSKDFRDLGLKKVLKEKI